MGTITVHDGLLADPANGSRDASTAVHVAIARAEDAVLQEFIGSLDSLSERPAC
jgi:hypothetical protein